MAWLYLFAAGVLECIWPIALKESAGFSKFTPSLVTIVVGALSLLLLSFAMRQIPIGTAYAAWTGIGATGVALIGILYYGDVATVARLGCITLIVAGVIGLRVFGAE
ncbi:MAG TPA: QacE family quaternary ammonium compound efflux SMR transporter [Gammaproteobacteria bacterium]|nr:QacE family quaternary ammonium compound efflux SMR transporter [Gammaproteobacteria bacterium]